MSEKKARKPVQKRYFTFFGGIAFCLFSVVLILNVGYVARAIAFPFAYLFGLGSYVIYILVYAYGLFLFFKEKGLKLKLNNIFFGGLIIFLSVLMIATLIVTRNSELNFSNFVSSYNDVVNKIPDSTNPKAVDGFSTYWNATFVNVFVNPFGGGFIGYFFVGLCNSGLKTTGTWVISILVFLLGAFVVFFPYIKKIIGKQGLKKEKAPVQDGERTIEFKSQTNDEIIASASRVDDVNETPTVISAQPMTKPANFNDRVETSSAPINNMPYNVSSNFAPAVFSKYQIKSQQVETPVQREPEHITPQQALLEANKQSTVNEQMQLNFDEKPVINDALAMAKPEFVEPVSASDPVDIRPVEQAPIKKPIKWIPPSAALLETVEVQGAIDLNNQVAEERVLAINEVFDDFKVGAKCVSYVVGPAVTRYNIDYGSSVSVRAVENLVRDISIRLGGVIARFQAVVQGSKYSGLEIPNAKITTVPFKEVYESLPDTKKHPLYVVFGKSIDGKCEGADFDEFPHILVAGTTGSGKSIYNHSLVCTLIMRNSPEDLKLVLIDPKQVEMSKYENLPHLLCPIIHDANVAKLTLSKLVDEMNRRYGILRETGCSNLKQYNEILAEDPSLEKLPYIMVFVDEYADLVDNCKDIAQPIVSLAQKARAAGIHMLISTQRPSTNIITGTIKGNLPTRVALKVASTVDSVTILSEGGAEKLMGKGDMLVQTPLIGQGTLVRLQGCFIQNKEILHIVGYLKEHYDVNYDPNFCNLEEAAAQAAAEVVGSPEFQSAQDASEEAKYQSVKEWVMANEYMSMSRIQRECSVGFNRAGKFFKRLQNEGIVSEEVEGNKGCPVLIHDKFYEGSVDTDIPVSTDQSE